MECSLHTCGSTFGSMVTRGSGLQERGRCVQRVSIDYSTLNVGWQGSVDLFGVWEVEVGHDGCKFFLVLC